MNNGSSFSVVTLDEQPYVAVRGRVTMTTFARVADRLPEVFGWLAGRHLTPAGPPFFRYRVIDMEAELLIEAGVPVAEPVATDGDLLTDVLPAGRYVTTTYVGHPDDLIEITDRLLRWAEGQGLTFEQHPSAEGEVWGCRLEWLETNPQAEPDPARWQTRLSFRLAD